MLVLENCNTFLKNATTHTSEFTLKNISIDQGKISTISDKVIPGINDTIIDVAGKYVTPGFIEPHCQCGLDEQGIGWEGHDSDELSDPIQGHCHCRDGINILDPGFADFRSHGITTAGIFPGNKNVIGGMGTVVKCKGSVLDEAILKTDAGLKASMGQNPKEVYEKQKKSPTTRMGIAALLRQFLLKEQSLGNKSQWKLLFTQKLPVMVSCQRHDDIQSALRIGKEFNLDLRLIGLADYEYIKNTLSQTKYPYCIGPILSCGYNNETENRNTIRMLQSKDFNTRGSLTTCHPETNGRYSSLQASILVQNGLDPLIALESVTINAARFLSIEDRVGSIETGKDGDLVVWSHHPLELTSQVTMTFIDGTIVYQG